MFACKTKKQTAMKTIFKSLLFTAVLALVMTGCNKNDNYLTDVNLKSTYADWAKSTGNIIPWLYNTGNANSCEDINYDCSEADICSGPINFDAETGMFDVAFPEGITVTMSADGKYVTWASDRPVTGAVVVKGGTDSHIYEYTECTSGDAGLVSPKNNGGQISTLSHLVFCFTYCEELCYDWRSETAWGGDLDPRAINPKNKKPEGAWFFIYDGDGAETLWAGQNEIAGTVELIGSDLVITLAEDWYLQDVDEPVKIEGYEEYPVVRPAAGLFATYKGDALSIPVGKYNFYAIHLDVMKKINVPCPVLE